MPRSASNCGPNGMTIMKSTSPMNCGAASANGTSRSRPAVPEAEELEVAGATVGAATTVLWASLWAVRCQRQ